MFWFYWNQTTHYYEPSINSWLCNLNALKMFPYVYITMICPKKLYDLSGYCFKTMVIWSFVKTLQTHWRWCWIDWLVHAGVIRPLLDHGWSQIMVVSRLKSHSHYLFRESCQHLLKRNFVLQQTHRGRLFQVVSARVMSVKPTLLKLTELIVFFRSAISVSG